MTKVLIDVLPSLGHFHASLKISKKLQSAGYDVVYNGSELLHKEIEKHGFEFVHLPKISFTKVNFAERTSWKNGFYFFLYWKLYQEKYNRAKREVEAFHNSIESINPDLVLVDEQEVSKTFLYETLDISVVAFQTKPDTRKIKGLPPFTSLYVPTFDLKSVFISNLLWFAQGIKYKFNYLYKRGLSIGQDNYSILKKIAKDYGINVRSRIDFTRSFGVGVKGLERLVLSPAAFDFPHTQKASVYRIGPLVDIKREGIIIKPRYNTLISGVLANKHNSEQFIIYCSLGTITRRFNKRVTEFFKKIVSVALLNTNCTFILSTGTDFEVEALCPVPENVYIFDNVPQVDLLQYCDLMITHGGMNSITECIYNKVPMLVYPLSKHWDQPGNSARIIYHGLGLRGRIKRDSVKTISQKLIKVKSNYNFYQKNVLEMRGKFEMKNNSDEILDIMKDFLNQK